MQIHFEQPNGDILAFLTGQVKQLYRKYKKQNL